jgi:hypothetical protein
MMQVNGGTAAAPAGPNTAMFIDLPPGAALILTEDTFPFVGTNGLVSADSIRLVNSQVNTASRAAFIWTERFLEESELQS